MNAFKQKLPELKIRYKKGHCIDAKITSSQEAADLLRSVFDADLIEYLEEMILLLVNRANQPLGFVKISLGGITGTVCDPRVVFGIALSAGACGLILAHNHPSGQLLASKQDIDLTKKLVAAGKLLDIQVLDHLIITSSGHYSLLDNGLL